MKRPLRINQVIGGLVAAVLLATSFLPSTVGAQASNANAADGLQISPALVEVNAEPGKSYAIELSVTNVTASDLAFDSAVNDFSARDETGTPSVNLDSDLPATASIRSWVTIVDSFDLDARQTRKLTATLEVPADAEPGGHYGVIRFSGRSPELQSSGVGLAASAGTLVLVRVAGATDEMLDLITFQAAQNGQGSGFFENGPLDFVMRFENKGNVHLKPIGQVEVRDMFGNKVETLTVNPSNGNVLPGSVRRFQAVLDKQWLFGRYTADISIAYGTTGQAVVRTISFWVIPYKLIGLGLIALLTLFFVLRTLIKRYNTYIINRANQHNASQKKPKSKK
jgi:hypothetical protein